MISTLPLVTWVKTLVVSSIVPTLILFELQAPERRTLLKETDYIFPFLCSCKNSIWGNIILMFSSLSLSSFSFVNLIHNGETLTSLVYEEWFSFVIPSRRNDAASKDYYIIPPGDNWSVIPMLTKLRLWYNY